MNDMNYLVMPATHFFSLPDYVFHDLRVPHWAYTLGPPKILRSEKPRRLLGGKVDVENCCGGASKSLENDEKRWKMMEKP